MPKKKYVALFAKFRAQESQAFPYSLQIGGCACGCGHLPSSPWRLKHVGLSLVWWVSPFPFALYEGLSSPQNSKKVCFPHLSANFVPSSAKFILITFLSIIHHDMISVIISLLSLLFLVVLFLHLILIEMNLYNLLLNTFEIFQKRTTHEFHTPYLSNILWYMFQCVPLLGSHLGMLVLTKQRMFD